MSEIAKRRLRNKIQKKESTSKNSKIGLTIFAITLVVFSISQIVINSMLNPLGAELRAYNVEKQAVLEENQRLEEELAETQSLTVVESMTEKKLKLADNSTNRVIYIKDESTHAQR